MKKAKKPKQQLFNKKQMRDLCRQFVSKSCIIMITAAADELNLGEDEICRIAERTQRYAEYEKDHLIKMDEISDMLKKKTGINWRW